MAKVAKQALDAAGLTAEDLAAFVPHQANMRIIDEMVKQLKLPESVVVARDIADAGNTSAASIPLATHRLLQENPALSRRTGAADRLRRRPGVRRAGHRPAVDCLAVVGPPLHSNQNQAAKRGLNPVRTPSGSTRKGATMASNEEILAGLAEIVNEETGLAPEAVEMDKSFTDDLDIDSISMMTIVVNAEEKFGVRIPDEEVKNLKTVGDAVSSSSTVIEIHFAGFLVVVNVCQGDAAAKARLGVLTENLEFARPHGFREKIGAEHVSAFIRCVMGIVSTEPIVIGKLAFDRDDTSIGQFPLEKKIKAAGFIGDIVG